MCIIIAKPKDVPMPSEEILGHCSRTNKDGMGIAWTHEGMVHIKKDFFSVWGLKDFIRDNVKDSEACLIHFRIATAGLKDDGNRHPFPLTRRSKRLRAVESVTDIAVAHNGTFSDMRDHKKYSDTMLFIKNVLSDSVVRNNLHSEAIQELITGYVGTSRLAMLDRDGRITRYGTFVTEDGVYYSHSGYKESTSTSTSVDGTKWNREKMVWDKQCNVCFDFFEFKLMSSIPDFGLVCQTCVAQMHSKPRLIEGSNHAEKS